VPADGALTVGRLPHPHIFESCLGAQHRFLTFISRRHADVVPVPGEPGCFEITCLSPNPIIVGLEQVSQGQRKVARAPTSLAFLASEGPDSPLIAFLTMRLEASDLPLSPASSAGFAPQTSQAQQQWQPAQAPRQAMAATGPMMHVPQMQATMEEPEEPVGQMEPLLRCRGAASPLTMGAFLGNTIQVLQVPIS